MNINTMPHEEYNRRMLKAVGSVRQALLKDAEEEEFASRRAENHGNLERAYRHEFLSRAYSFAAYLLMKNFTCDELKNWRENETTD